MNKTKQEFSLSGNSVFLPTIFGPHHIRIFRSSESEKNSELLSLIAETDIYTEPQKFHLGSVFAQNSVCLRPQEQ